MRQIDLVANKLIKATLHEISIEYDVVSSSNRYIFVLARKDVLVNIILGRTSYCDIALKSGDSFRAVESFKDTSAIKTDGVTGQSVLINSSKKVPQEDIARINTRAIVEYDDFDGELNYVLEGAKHEYDGKVDFVLYPNNGSLVGRKYRDLSISHKEHKDSCIIKLIDDIRALGNDIVKLSFVRLDEEDKDSLMISVFLGRKDTCRQDTELLLALEIDPLSHEVLWTKSDVFKPQTAPNKKLQKLVSVFTDENISYEAVLHAMDTQPSDTIIDAMINIK